MRLVADDGEYLAAARFMCVRMTESNLPPPSMRHPILHAGLVVMITLVGNSIVDILNGPIDGGIVRTGLVLLGVGSP